MASNKKVQDDNSEELNCSLMFAQAGNSMAKNTILKIDQHKNGKAYSISKKSLIFMNHILRKSKCISTDSN